MRLLRKAVLFLSFALLCAPAVAQEELDQLLVESVEDGRKLVGAYISPFMKSVSLGLNQGWYNTAKAHKIAGIDITVTVNAMTVPDDELLFRPSTLGLTQVELDPSSTNYPNSPTMLGPDNAPLFRLKADPTQTFQGPPGLGLEENIGFNKVPVPIAHVGFGLVKNTDVKIRFTPTLNFDDATTFKLFGIGVMHDLKQWIPGMKLLPFEFSGFVGFTRLNMESQLDEDNPSNADQKGVFSITATTVQGLVSKKFSILTLYGGLGYNIAKSNVGLEGKYDLNEDGDEDDPYETNPVNLDFGASGPRATAGMRLKLAVLTLHADYTIQKYKCLTVGVGLSIR